MAQRDSDRGGFETVRSSPTASPLALRDPPVGGCVYMKSRSMTEGSAVQRPIRSYVRREGRMTEAQKRALAELLPRYGIGGEGLLDLVAVFGRRAPVLLEIGFGAGEALATLAAQHPEQNYLGIEVHRPGVGRLLQRVHEQGLANVRVLIGDAAELLAQRLPDESLAGVYLFFPDPWPKKRHHKRRLVQPAFVALLCRKLAPGGLLHAATDWQDYAEHMMAVFSQAAVLENTAGPLRFAARPAERPLTRYEQRARALGHRVWDLIFRKTRSEERASGVLPPDPAAKPTETAHEMPPRPPT